MKKVLALLVALMLLCSSVAFASTDIDKVVFELTSFGILKGDGDGNLRLEDTVTRAEFAQIVVRMLGFDELAQGEKSSFPDVPDSSWMAGPVSLLSYLGYVSGDTNGNYRPNDPVLVQECEKILLNVLGYEPVAEAYGGYPTGYTRLSAQIRLNDGVSASPKAYATRADAARLVYNALYSYPLETYKTDMSSFQKSDELFVARLLRNGSIKHESGIVTATYDTWLSKPLTDIEENQIEINGKLFDKGNINADEYLGYFVEVYYMEENSGKREILNLAPSRQNSRKEIYAKDVTAVTSSTISYKNENSKKDEVSVSNSTIWLYNNRVMSEYSLSDLKIEKGSYVLINNDYDREYEYVFIYEYESGVVDRVNINGCIYVSNKTPIFGRDYVIAKESDNVIYRITDVNGQKITLSDIEEGDVITVYESSDSSYVGIEVSKQSVTGYYEMLETGESITISGTDYPIDNSLDLSEVRFGNHVIAYINSYGEVIFVETAEDTPENYGYVMEAGGGGLGSGNQLRMIVSNTVVLDTEASDDQDDANLIPVLICRNSEIVVFDLEDKVKFNGSKINASDVAGRLEENVPVKYALSVNGKIKELELLDLQYGSTITKMQYNAKDKTFGGIAGINPFGVNEETKVICLPTNADADEDDILSQIKIDNRDATVKYLAAGYELDEDSQCVKLIMVMQEMDADTVLNITSSSDIGVVTGSAYIRNEDDEFVSEITILCDGKEVKFVSEGFTSENGDAQNLKEGDFIIYETNVEGELTNAKIIKRLSHSMEHNQNNQGAVNGSVTGVVMDVHRLQINNEQNKRVHIIDLKVGEFYYSVELPARNIPFIYIYDEGADETVTVGSIDDIVYGDILTVSMPNGNVADCVITRGE